MSSKQLGLICFGPMEIIAGQKFNVQKNGESAIWARTINATRTTIIVVNGIELYSSVSVNGDIVTADVPEWLYKYPGEYEIYLKDTKTYERSNSLRIIIQESEKNKSDIESNIIEKLRMENLELHRQAWELQKIGTPKFQGWQMSTYHELPWIDKHDWGSFRQSSRDIKEIFEFALTDEVGINRDNVDSLLWRHWVVAFSVRYAIKFSETNFKELAFVECGVGDGMTAFFALREIKDYVSKNRENKYTMHLYDSWSEMRRDELLEEESGMIGHYSSNSLFRTKKNLHEFEKNIKYHVGYIPEILAQQPQITESIVFLHIDLNSAIPTLETLKYFYPRLKRGSVVLFDDYGWAGYEKTKEIIDEFLLDKPGMLMKLPTGQAIFFV